MTARAPQPTAVALCAMILAAAFASSLLSSAHAQQRPDPPSGPITVLGKVDYETLNPHWRDCGLRPYDMPGRTRVDETQAFQPQVPSANQTQSASIQVDYGSGFTPEAQEAFQRAIDIWETHISSDVTIRVDAAFSPLDTGVLGGAGPSFGYPVDTDGDGTADRVYTDAIADAILGQDQSPGFPDINITFNSEFANWYFGEGATPSNQTDFTSVVLHEIGHGLSYLDLLSFEQGEGAYGEIDLNGNGVLEPDENNIGIFGSFLFEEQDDGTLLPLSDPTFFPNPSTELGDALTGNRLYFNGPLANLGASTSTGPVPPRVYAPFSFSPGSSIAHLDEATYGPGDPNSLMTPQIGDGETERTPGPVMCGQLSDMGWTLASGCERFFRSVVSIEGTASEEEGAFTFTWRTSDDANIQEYFVERSTFGSPFERVAFERSGTSATVRDVGLGEFAFRLGWVNADGETSRSAPVQATYNLVEVAAASENATDLGRADVRINWQVPPGTQEGRNGLTYEYVVEEKRGIDGEFRPVASGLRSTELVLGGDANEDTRRRTGRYEYRVTAVVRRADGSGDAFRLSRSAPNPVQINTDDLGDVFIVGPFPSPTDGPAVVEITASRSQNVKVEIFNTIGQRLVYEEKSLSGLAPATLNIPGGRWASGMYFIRVTGDEFTATEQFVVL